MSRAWLGALTVSMIASAASGRNAIFFGRIRLSTLRPRFLLLTVGRLRRHGRFTSSRARRLGIVVRAMVLAGAFRFFGRGAAPGAIQRPSNNSRRARLDCREEGDSKNASRLWLPMAKQ